MTDCSPKQYNEIEAVCRARARTVVLDRNLFSEWLRQAREQAAERSSGPESPSKMIGYEAVPGYEFRYGPELSVLREQSTDEIRQDDVYLVKDGRRVAQFIDFIVLIRGPAMSTSMSCFGSYPDLYFGDL